MFNKVTSRSYGYFPKFSYFFWYRNGFLQVGQKLQKLVKKIEGILGVKLSFSKYSELKKIHYMVIRFFCKIHSYRKRKTSHDDF
jgi:hypothetical protein